jgi:endogenous inhibitor of DNA gyrase (YacG/DUF329 family)
MQYNPNTSMRECPNCGKEVKRSAHICPHCHKSLAEYDQQKWERESPLPVSNEIPVPITTRSLKQIILNPLLLFFLIAIIFGITLVLLPPRKTEVREEDNAKASAAKMEQAQPEPPRRYEIVDITTSQAPAAQPPSTQQGTTDEIFDARRKAYEEARARKQQITLLADDIFAKLEEEETITTDILYLKSGRELHCTIIEDLDTQLKVRYKGVTTAIEKTDIGKMKHRSQQSVDIQMRRMSLEQAALIVDNGLVQYKNEWITPEEREITIRGEKLELEKERLKVQAAAKAQKQRAQKPTIKQVKTPPVTIGEGVDFSSVVITEGRGFGDIIVGHPRCTKQFLKSKLGKPDIEKKDLLDYEWKYGMRFVFATDSDLLIQISLKRRFKGKLSSGITMSSTMEEVFEAYGEPRAEEEVDALNLGYLNYANRTLYQKDLYSIIWYRDLGLYFSFEEDGIALITVMRI